MISDLTDFGEHPQATRDIYRMRMLGRGEQYVPV
jgi:hypothetical protein